MTTNADQHKITKVLTRVGVRHVVASLSASFTTEEKAKAAIQKRVRAIEEKAQRTQAKPS